MFVLDLHDKPDMGVEGACVSIHLHSNNQFVGLVVDLRHLHVQRNHIDGDTDALVRYATRGSTPAVVVFQNVLRDMNSFKLFANVGQLQTLTSCPLDTG